MYMILMELKFLFICYLYIHFHLTTIIEGDEMYDSLFEMVPRQSDKTTTLKYD